jgi:hypothetical protein
MCPFCTPLKFRQFQLNYLECLAGTTGLEPATSAVTESFVGRRSEKIGEAASLHVHATGLRRDGKNVAPPAVFDGHPQVPSRTALFGAVEKGHVMTQGNLQPPEGPFPVDLPPSSTTPQP